MMAMVTAWTVAMETAGTVVMVTAMTAVMVTAMTVVMVTAMTVVMEIAMSVKRRKKTQMMSTTHTILPRTTTQRCSALTQMLHTQFTPCQPIVLMITILKDPITILNKVHSIWL